MPEILISNGNGIGFTSDDPPKLKVKISGANISDRANGIYVPSLKGNDGTGGSRVDGHSIIEGTSIYSPYDVIPDVNRNVVNLIYSMCAYKITNRGTGSSTAITVDTTQEKNMGDIVDEANKPLQYFGGNWTSYNMKVGELFQLIDTPHGRSVYQNSSMNSYIAVEDGNRYPNNANTTLALFCITDISYSNAWMNSIRLVCLYSTLSSYNRGQAYWP